MNAHNSTNKLLKGTEYKLRQLLIPSPQPPVVVKALDDRAEIVRSISAKTGISIPILGQAPLFDDYKLVTHTAPNWVIYNLSHDPLWKNGKFPIPLIHLERLKHLYRRGIEFDALYVAHELPLDFCSDSDPLELSLVKPAPPIIATRLSEGLGLAADSILATYARAIKVPVKGLAIAGATGLAILRDPVLIGAIIPPATNPQVGVPAIWFLLAAWRW